MSEADIQRMAELRSMVRDAPMRRRARGEAGGAGSLCRAAQCEPAWAAMMRAVAAKEPNPPSPEKLDRIAREAAEERQRYKAPA